MDLFEFDFFRDWELEQQCHYEQDRSALKKKEWERRTQEVQQDEDLFSTGFNLFGEPYKTNKGDALANRVQNTLGNYDEMKELLTSHSSQSHLVGIPKNSIPQTPVEKVDQPSFFSEAQRSRGASSQPGNHAASMPPPPTTALPGPNVLHQGNKKSRSSDWSRGAHSASGGQTGQPAGRGKHPGHDQSSVRHEPEQGDASPSTASTSTHPSRRHGPSAKAPAPAELGHGKSPGEQEPGSHGCGSPVASTSLLPGGLSTPTFPQGLHCKSSSAVQQKPTAYVRPMDGQDQVPNDSPELKPPPEIGDSYGGATFGALLDGKGSTAGSKAKLPKLNLPQSGEVSLSNDSSCVEEILREMTHSWPPPLTAIHTPGKAEQTKFPIPTKDHQHVPSGYTGQKRCSVPGNKPATKSVPHKSMLEDDLKISSDEDDSEQATEKPKARSAPANLPGPTPRSSDPAGHSSGASGSSSESESSSESDSDSESSSSDSECNRATRAATPEPEPPSTNKWQLDKWLNKVNPHNKALTNTQPESHGLSRSQPEEDQAAESQNCSKSKPSASLAQADSKDRALLSPIREKAKPKMGQKAPDGKGAKVKTPATVDLAPSRRSTGKKQPKKVERSSSSEEHNWPRPANSSTTQKEKEPPPLEPAKARGKAPGGKTAPRKEPRSTAVTTTAATSTTAADKKKHRGPSKIIPKSKEFIETESSSSECHSDPEELSKVHLPCPGPSNLNLKSKDCNSNILSVSSLASTSSTSIPDPGTTDLLEEPFFSPIPMVQNELLSPLRDFEDIKSLWVKIELSLLSRIPGQDPPEPPPPTKAECREPSVKHRRQQSPASIPPEKPTSKSKRKHKSEHCEVLSGSKKLRLEKEALLLPPCISPIHNHKVSSTKDRGRQPRKLLPPLLSPLSDEPVGRQRRCSEGSSLSVEASATAPATIPSVHALAPLSSSSSSSSSSSHKHRKGESKAHSKNSCQEEDSHSKPASGFHGNGQSEPDVWPNPSSLSVENMEPRRPKLTFNNTVHNADYYMQEAKKLKHKADALMEKFGKAVNYADGALSFIECGSAMERDPLEAKSPYTMYSETVELIRYAMRLKNFTSHSATLAEKKLAVLCNRCLSLLYLRMFKLKKEHAMKYSRSLMEYFKNSAKSSQAPSPWGANGKSTGTPSPMSLSPSPISSVSSSTGAVGSSSSSSSSSSSGSVAIPQRIHHMAASHVNITNNILRSYEHWDTADKLAHESQEFFQELDSVMEPLTQHSSMTELVRYIRQGLHWLRIEAHLL
ncbi:AF4/FMR2 family member 2 [Electrophorus electricus]|uniref:AF4/FMR2 family member 2 n=1 Tax=Electrophorus electricus TaxID=8005 RepID=UPI0015D07059|nr:AF4/FMR2 family member 2 [Electrophorus electricus]